MYRKGESKLFDNPGDVPADEGWVDSPAAVVEAEETAKKAKIKRDKSVKLDGEADGDGA